MSYSSPLSKKVHASQPLVEPRRHRVDTSLLRDGDSCSDGSSAEYLPPLAPEDGDSDDDESEVRKSEEEEDLDSPQPQARGKKKPTRGDIAALRVTDTASGAPGKRKAMLVLLVSLV